MHMESKIEEVPRDEVDVHRHLHEDPEKLPAKDAPKRRQPFGAVWTVIACGFALMSDGVMILHRNTDL